MSIVAGATIASISAGLRHAAIVRTMPNTPAQVGEGMTVWTATPEVSAAQRAQAGAIVGALGRHLFVDDERFLDMATAISGSGPAYVFLMMEALIDAAVHLGFSRSDARELVVQTIRGSAIYAEQQPVHPAELRNRVTSPGGTSADALYQLEKGAFRTVMSKAVLAAFQRSVALGEMSTRRGRRVEAVARRSPPGRLRPCPGQPFSPRSSAAQIPDPSIAFGWLCLAVAAAGMRRARRLLAPPARREAPGPRLGQWSIQSCQLRPAPARFPRNDALGTWQGNSRQPPYGQSQPNAPAVSSA